MPVRLSAVVPVSNAGTVHQIRWELACSHRRSVGLGITGKKAALASVGSSVCRPRVSLVLFSTAAVCYLLTPLSGLVTLCGGTSGPGLGYSVRRTEITCRKLRLLLFIRTALCFIFGWCTRSPGLRT